MADVDGMQKRLEAFIGEPVIAPISRFHTAVPTNFRDLPALNGLRARSTRMASDAGATQSTGSGFGRCLNRFRRLHGG